MSGREQLFVSVKLNPPLLYVMKRTERGKLIEMRWKSGKSFALQEIRGELYLGRALSLATVDQLKAIHEELLKELKELSPQVDEKEMRLYIIPQKILCSSSSDPALLEEQKF